MSNEEVQRLLAEGKTARARQLMREMGEEAPAGTRPGRPYIALLLLGVTLVVITAVLWGLSLLGVAALERLAPFFEILALPLTYLLVSPTALVIAGGVFVFVGLRLAPKFRRPARFRNGAVAVALAVGTFWPLQFLVSQVDVRFSEYSWGLRLLAGFVSVCLLTGGLELMRMANNTSRDDSWEFLR